MWRLWCGHPVRG